MTRLEKAGKEYEEAYAEYRALRAAQDKLREQITSLERESSAISARIHGKQVHGKHHRNGNAFYDGVEDRVRVCRENLLAAAAGENIDE